jgi:hypothetical protein
MLEITAQEKANEAYHGRIGKSDKRRDSVIGPLLLQGAR